MAFFFCICQLQAQTFGYFASAVYLKDSASSAFYSTAPTSGVNAISTNNFNSFLGSYIERAGNLTMAGGEVKTWFNRSESEGEAVGVCGVNLYFAVYPEGNRPASPSFTSIPLSYFDSCSNGAFPTGGPCSVGDEKWQTTGGTYGLSTFAPGTYTLEVYYRVSGTSSVDGENPCGEYVYDNNNNNPTNYTASFTVTPAPPPPPVPTIKTVPTTVKNLCPGSSVKLTSSAKTGNHWSTGDTTQSITIDTAGSYYVTVTANGQSSMSAVKTVTYAKCGAPSAKSPTAIASTSATVNWSSVSCAAEYTLVYRKNGTSGFKTIITSDTTYNLTGLVAGTTYQWKVRTVCVESPVTASGYTALANFTTTTTLALNPVQEKMNNVLSLVPNPAHSSMTVSFSTAEANAIVQVINSTGQSILQKQVSTFGGTNTTQLDVSSLAPGNYMLLVKTKNGIETKQFVKE